MSAECGKCFDAKECLQFGCQKPERRMETAKDILNKNCRASWSLEGPSEESMLKAMQEIADKAWEAGNGYGYNSGRGYIEIQDQGDKSTFMKSLFPDKI